MCSVVVAALARATKHAYCLSTSMSNAAVHQDIHQGVSLTRLSSISLIFLSLPAAINVFMSGVAATALHTAEAKQQGQP